MLASVVKIIDLTEEPVCKDCLLRKIENGYRNEILACRSVVEAVKLTTEQVEAIIPKAWIKHRRADPLVILGLSVWEVAK